MHENLLSLTPVKHKPYTMHNGLYLRSLLARSHFARILYRIENFAYKFHVCALAVMYSEYCMSNIVNWLLSDNREHVRCTQCMEAAQTIHIPASMVGAS